MGSILHSIKGFSGKQIPSVMPHIGKLWQDGRHERLVVGDRHFQSAVKYILQNPAVAQIVKPPETYPYCWSNPPITPSASVSLASKPKSVSLASKPKSVSLASKPKSVSLASKPENNPNEQLREWAQEQLQQMENQGGSSEWT